MARSLSYAGGRVAVTVVVVVVLVVVVVVAAVVGCLCVFCIQISVAGINMTAL